MNIDFMVDAGVDKLRLKLVGRSVVVTRMPDGPWMVTVIPGRSYEFGTVTEVNDFVTGMACGDMYNVVIGEIARLHALSRYNKEEQEPTIVLVITPRQEYFEAYMTENHGASCKEREGVVVVGRTTYRHIRNGQQARGYGRDIPIVLAHEWEKCADISTIIDHFPNQKSPEKEKS
jgi:hypothetical protein